jgi:hypothetical protein
MSTTLATLSCPRIAIAIQDRLHTFIRGILLKIVGFMIWLLFASVMCPKTAGSGSEMIFLVAIGTE